MPNCSLKVSCTNTKLTQFCLISCSNYPVYHYNAPCTPPSGINMSYLCQGLSHDPSNIGLPSSVIPSTSCTPSSGYSTTLSAAAAASCSASVYGTPLPHLGGGGGAASLTSLSPSVSTVDLNGVSVVKRSRVFIDPLTEVNIRRN